MKIYNKISEAVAQLSPEDFCVTPKTTGMSLLELSRRGAGFMWSAPFWNRSRWQPSPSSWDSGVSLVLSPLARHDRDDARFRRTAQRRAPQTAHFPMSRINEAFARLEIGQARYRIVLDADFSMATHEMSKGTYDDP